MSENQGPLKVLNPLEAWLADILEQLAQAQQHPVRLGPALCIDHCDKHIIFNHRISKRKLPVSAQNNDIMITLSSLRGSAAFQLSWH